MNPVLYTSTDSPPSSIVTLVTTRESFGLPGNSVYGGRAVFYCTARVIERPVVIQLCRGPRCRMEDSPPGIMEASKFRCQESTLVLTSSLYVRIVDTVRNYIRYPFVNTHALGPMKYLYLLSRRFASTINAWNTRSSDSEATVAFTLDMAL